MDAGACPRSRWNGPPKAPKCGAFSFLLAKSAEVCSRAGPQLLRHRPASAEQLASSTLTRKPAAFFCCRRTAAQNIPERANRRRLELRCRLEADNQRKQKTSSGRAGMGLRVGWPRPSTEQPAHFRRPAKAIKDEGPKPKKNNNQRDRTGGPGARAVAARTERPGQWYDGRKGPRGPLISTKQDRAGSASSPAVGPDQSARRRCPKSRERETSGNPQRKRRTASTSTNKDRPALHCQRARARALFPILRRFLRLVAKGQCSSNLPEPNRQARST